jgi:outer membrane lipoprotein-sorting protein
MEMKGSAKIKRPNLARIETKGMMAQTVASDGKTVWTLMKDANQYMKQAADAEGKNLANAVIPNFPLAFFLNPKADFLTPGAAVKFTGVSTETVAGKSYQMISGSVEKPFQGEIKLYVGADKLMHRLALTIKQGSDSLLLETTLQNIKTGVALAASAFAYTPPKTAKAFEQPNFEARLVKVGADAPNFTLPTPTGGQVALTELLKGKKATLINFWFHG